MRFIVSGERRGVSPPRLGNLGRADASPFVKCEGLKSPPPPKSPAPAEVATAA